MIKMQYMINTCFVEKQKNAFCNYTVYVQCYTNLQILFDNLEKKRENYLGKKRVKADIGKGRGRMKSTMEIKQNIFSKKT